MSSGQDARTALPHLLVERKARGCELSEPLDRSDARRNELCASDRRTECSARLPAPLVALRKLTPTAVGGEVFEGGINGDFGHPDEDGMRGFPFVVAHWVARVYLAAFG